MAKCLVLGANGFLGSHLVDSLADAGHEIVAFDRFDANLEPRFQASPNVQLLTGDFLNRHDLHQAVQGMDYVFHFISTTTPVTAENDPLIDIETNVKMSVELFEECAQAKVKKVVFPSTGGAIYGNLDTNEPLSETTLPQPVSPYAIGKLTIEHYLRYFERKFGLQSVVYRISNPYGERQSLVSKQGVIPIFLQKILGDEPLTIFGNGSMVRDYIYIEDATNMIAKTFVDAKLPLYNLGMGQGASINELIEIMKKIVGKPIKTESQENLSTFVDHVVLDTGRFKSEFSIAPKVSLEEGIRKTWEYVQTSNQD